MDSGFFTQHDLIVCSSFNMLPGNLSDVMRCKLNTHVNDDLDLNLMSVPDSKWYTPACRVV